MVFLKGGDGDFGGSSAPIIMNPCFPLWDREREGEELFCNM